MMMVEAFKSGRLPKALETGESPQGAFQIILHASAVQTVPGSCFLDNN